MLVRDPNPLQALHRLECQIRELIESFQQAADYQVRVQRTGLDQAQFAELDVRVKLCLRAA